MKKLKIIKKLKKLIFLGSGEYPITVKINEKGKYAVSNITNISSLKFGDKDKKRFVYNISKFPSPGKYELKPLFGKIFDSRYRSNSGITIGGRYKNIDSRSIILVLVLIDYLLILVNIQVKMLISILVKMSVLLKNILLKKKLGDME